MTPLFFYKLFKVGVMSLYGVRRLSVSPLAGVERHGRGSVGGGGAEVGLLFPSCRRLDCLWNPSLFCCTCLLRAFSRLFVVMKGSGSWGPVSLVYPHPESPQDSLHGGDFSICASVCVEWRLDGLHRLEGHLLASFHTSGQSQVSQFCRFESCLFQSKALVRSLYGSAGLHTGHGSGLSHSASPGYSHVQIPGRLVHPQLQRVVYLGVILDSTLFRASPSQPRVEKLCLIVEFLTCDAQLVSLW